MLQKRVFSFYKLEKRFKNVFSCCKLEETLEKCVFFILQTLETLTCFSFCKLENASKKLFHVVNFKNKSNTCLFILQT